MKYITGGVAMGASADMMVHPYGALIIGLGAGTVSTLGYKYLQVCIAPKLHEGLIG